MKIKNCCFTGHRQIKNTDIIRLRLIETIRVFINEYGTTDFFAGGALGWDMLCEETILELKKEYSFIRLHIVLPCPEEEQTSKWSEKEKARYKSIIMRADSVECVSEGYYEGCMKRRNERLTGQTEGCICYYNEKKPFSGTGQTVRMAIQKNMKIVNIY